MTALSDLVIALEDKSSMIITGPSTYSPDRVEHQLTPSQLGGAISHARSTGHVHLLASSEYNSISLARRAMYYLCKKQRKQWRYVRVLRILPLVFLFL